MISQTIFFSLQYRCLEEGETEYAYHPDNFLWNCFDGICTGQSPVDGELIFDDPMPTYTEFGPHQWPLDPDQCYVAVMNLNTGASPPPYDVKCVGEEFFLPSN
jgi:hypothetical protein